MIYTSGFPNERLKLKLFVYMVFTLEVVQTIILTKSFFDVFGYGFGEPESYDRVGAIWFSVSFLSGIGQYSLWAVVLKVLRVFWKLIRLILTVAFLTQMFYAVRLHKLSNSYRVPIVVSLVCLSSINSIHKILTLHANLQLAVTQAAGAIYNASILKSAGRFSRLPQKPFRVSNLVGVVPFMVY